MRAIERQYGGAKAIATMGLNNFCGMEILAIEYGIDDYVIVRGFIDDLHRYKIHYETERPYFRYCNGCRYHLDEFIRV